MNPSTDQLIHRHLDGDLSAAEQAELNHRLKTEADAPDRFVEIATLHHALEDGFESGTLSTRIESPKILRPSFGSKLKPALPWLVAGAAAVIALLTFTQKTDTQTAPIAEAELHDSGFAVLTRVVDATWASDAPEQGDFLSAGQFSLTSGLAQIEFLSGVSLVVEGDAEFEILSSDEMNLVRGKLRANVPPQAIGFQIHTPRGTALDLGTEFALDLSDEKCELHVIDGEVEWHPNDDIETLLTGGKGLLISDSAPAQISADPARFTSSSQLAEQLVTRQRKQLDAWKSHSADLRSHADLLAYFPFDQAGSWNRQLQPTQTDLSPGSIVAAERVTGRWPGKNALDFSPNGSRVRVTIPGEYQQVTFSTWARIDSLDRQFNALFLTDNYEEGEPHWQLTSEGQLFFSVRLEKDKLHHINLSPPVWNHASSQQGLHLVTTFDAPTRTTVHYLNGGEISREQAPTDKAVPAIRIGNAQIGNWGLPTKTDPEFAVRNLNGRLDEFAIFSSALSPTEVQSLYLSGKP
ncbi:MAG: FecR domain-containing protein [Akkermansiaceae bacterium]